MDRMTEQRPGQEGLPQSDFSEHAMRAYCGISPIFAAHTCSYLRNLIARTGTDMKPLFFRINLDVWAVLLQRARNQISQKMGMLGARHIPIGVGIAQ